MRDMLEAASAWLDKVRLAHMSRTVEYARGAKTVADGVRASIGQTVFESEDALGVVERFESRDYIVPAADLVLDGALATPERGDRIREANAAGAVFVYEVMAPGQEPCWRYSDNYRRTFRIHTKLVDTEEEET